MFGAGPHLVDEFVEQQQVTVGDDLGDLGDQALLERSARLKQMKKRNPVGLQAIGQLLDQRTEAEGADEQSLAAADLHHAVRLEAAESLADRGLPNVEQSSQLSLRGQRVSRLESLVDDEGTDGIAGFV
jgi:hypothetical protein